MRRVQNITNNVDKSLQRKIPARAITDSKGKKQLKKDLNMLRLCCTLFNEDTMGLLSAENCLEKNIFQRSTALRISDVC